MASGTGKAAAGTVLVCGALGTVGRAMVEHFDAQPGWRVVGLSRRAPDFPTGAEFRSIDLRDRAACEAGLSDLHDITRVVYAAVYEKADVASGWRDPDHAETNLAMLRNAVEAALIVARAAYHNRQSRGCHYRQDSELASFRVRNRRLEAQFTELTRVDSEEKDLVAAYR